MHKRPVRWMATLALVVGTMTACQDSPTDVSLPLDDASSEVTPATASAYWSGSLVATAFESLGETGEAIIGRNGGTIRVGEHSLEVPRNTVFTDTRFTMQVVAGTSIVVNLNAEDVASGETVSTFQNELTLTLSYRNVYSGADVKRLTNVYLQNDSPFELIRLPSTLSRKDKTISSPIDHFSLYGMAME